MGVADLAARAHARHAVHPNAVHHLLVRDAAKAHRHHIDLMAERDDVPREVERGCRAASAKRRELVVEHQDAHAATSDGRTPPARRLTRAPNGCGGPAPRRDAGEAEERRCQSGAELPSRKNGPPGSRQERAARAARLWHRSVRGIKARELLSFLEDDSIAGGPSAGQAAAARAPHRYAVPAARGPAPSAPRAAHPPSAR